ncbi:MAG TPA: hypothetical protein PKC18_06675 [Lacipirellulaceae bacterium]|nr:hypothetical protein [Lacipirellulaceae bacterium]HMP05842.1 hypothetical protein [Lacipirellulaceae bacterium]
MPRHGELSDEEKARAVLCRTGQPGNRCAAFSAAELAELAAAYDECVAPELLLAERVRQFWAARQERLDAAKAVDDAQPDASFFRHANDDAAEA